MDILIAFSLGSFLGFTATVFIIGAVADKREQEAYMEGYLEGQRYAGNGKWN